LKKYSKLIILMTVVVVSLAVYYGKASSLSKLFAQFEFITIEGDEAALDPLIIKGDHYTSYFDYEQFTLTKDKVHYERDNNLFERLDDIYLSQKVAKLQKENRNFMRMKDFDPDSYTRVGDTVIYATVPSTRWGVAKGYIQVERYDQKTKETKENHIQTDELMEYASIIGLFVRDDHLYIVVSSEEYDAPAEVDKGAFHIFNYDLANESLVDTYEIDLAKVDYYNQMIEVFVDQEENPNELVVVSSIFEYDDTAVSDEEDAQTSQEEFELERPKITTIEKINLQTGERTQTKFTSELENSLPLAYDGKELIILTTADNGRLTFSSYDLSTNKTQEKFTTETELKMNAIGDFSNKVIADDKVYMLMNDEEENRAQVIVIDIAAKSLLYRGLVESETSDLLPHDNSDVYFHTLEIVE